MKVLITGATGFIGSNLVKEISCRDVDCRLLLPCRDPEKGEQLRNSISKSDIEICKADDWNSVRNFNPDIVIHLAAFSTADNNSDVIDRLVESNITYGIKMLDALRDCDNLRLFVNTGSFAEYRHGPMKTNNSYLYSTTKTAFRSFLDYYSDLGRYRYVTAVPYSVYGGYSQVKRVFDYMLESIDSEIPVGMTNGEQVLDFTHVDDIVTFYISTIEGIRDFINLEQGYEFHLGTGLGHTLRDIAKMIETECGKKLNINWGERPYRERDTMYAVAPISANLKLWKARIPIEEGIRKFISDRTIQHK